MPDHEPADENISPDPPNEFDRGEGSHDPGSESPARHATKYGMSDEDFEENGRRRKRRLKKP